MPPRMHRRRTLAAAALVAAFAGPVLVAAPTQAATKPFTLKVAHKTVVEGRYLHIDGLVKPGRARPINVQAKMDGHWEDVFGFLTERDGEADIDALGFDPGKHEPAGVRPALQVVQGDRVEHRHVDRHRAHPHHRRVLARGARRRPGHEAQRRPAPGVDRPRGQGAAPGERPLGRLEVGHDRQGPVGRERADRHRHPARLPRRRRRHQEQDGPEDPPLRPDPALRHRRLRHPDVGHRRLGRRGDGDRLDRVGRPVRAHDQPAAALRSHLAPGGPGHRREQRGVLGAHHADRAWARAPTGSSC
nr:hypothetical protein [Angustibacter aerolatus]